MGVYMYIHMHYYYNNFSTTITEPSGAPKSIQIQVLSSTSIAVYWDPPDALDQNGVITGYLISVTDVLLNVENTFNITVDQRHFIIDGTFPVHFHI